MPPGIAFALLVLVGLVVAAASYVAIRASGGSPGRGRRLAGPPEVRVGELLEADALPLRAVRVTGRIRCREPLELGDGERLVAFHRDVEVHAGGRWRSVERMRETRSFDLWDHDGSIPIDPAEAAEPLVTIPGVWRGGVAELEEPHASAAAAIAARHGTPRGARAITRTINVTDRLFVVGIPRRDEDGRVRLDPPPGGYLVTNLALPDAMRTLGGRRPRLAAAGVIGLGMATALVVVGGIGAFLSAFLR
ncbi:MAG TPA: GIDE domain-containing protein [Candidatus Limnocylindria bacterium]|nr:GIDE domain-containing protein [Candidatus Limnocylindria bacterium]